MVASIKSQRSLKMGHAGSKTMSLGQILKISCICSRSHYFSVILMKIGQIVCLDEISDKFENGYVVSKTRPLSQV